MTGPRSNLLGFFRLSYDDCVDETELTVHQINTAIKVGEAKDFLIYDRDSRYVWVINRLAKEFPKGEMNDIQRRGIMKSLEDAPCYKLILRICEKYLYFGEPFVTLGERVRERVGPTLGKRDGKQRAESRIQKAESRKPEAESIVAEFENSFWTEWPEEYRSKKQDALREFIRARKAGTSLAEIIEGIKRQKQGRRWREGFVPHPDRWIKKGRWTDAVVGDKKISREATATGEAAADFIKRKEKNGGKDV